MNKGPESSSNDHESEMAFRAIAADLDDLQDFEPKFVSASDDISIIRKIYTDCLDAIDIQSADSLKAFLDLATQLSQRLEGALEEHLIGLKTGDYVMAGGEIPFYTENEDHQPKPLDINPGSVIVGTVKAIEPGIMPLEDYKRYHLSSQNETGLLFYPTMRLEYARLLDGHPNRPLYRGDVIVPLSSNLDLWLMPTS